LILKSHPGLLLQKRVNYPYTSGNLLLRTRDLKKEF
jgi:hypothetical protein